MTTYPNPNPFTLWVNAAIQGYPINLKKVGDIDEKLQKVYKSRIPRFWLTISLPYIPLNEARTEVSWFNPIFEIEAANGIGSVFITLRENDFSIKAKLIDPNAQACGEVLSQKILSMADNGISYMYSRISYETLGNIMAAITRVEKEVPFLFSFKTYFRYEIR